MKKYLMFAFAALAFVGCSKSEDVSDSSHTVQGDKYENAFLKEFGVSKIASTVNWGFGTPQTANYDKDGNFTGFTRAAMPNANQWGMTMYVPEEMTEAQKAKVKKYFDETKLSQGISVNWSDFFVHQVSQTEKGKQMNFLYCGAEKFAAKDHVNNFNGGSSTDKKNVGVEPQDENNARQVDYYDGIMLVQNSSTNLFAFHNSYDDTYYEDNFIMISGEMIDEAYPEAPSVAGMWFVGFDYEHDKTKMGENDIEERDYYFNDWVIRVSPGFYRSAERVFVEDLIATNLEDVQSSDWDFNDAVFDVAFESYWENGGNVRDAIITLRAAGGILPLTVGGKEVHAAMLQDQNVMINTNAGKYGKAADGVAPAIFRIVGVDANATANDIKVIVNGSTELKAVQGEATQKLCGPTNKDWCGEKVNIKTVYTNFVPYVQGNSSTWY